MYIDYTSKPVDTIGYEKLDYDVNDPIKDYLTKLNKLQLDSKHKKAIYIKIMQMSTCKQAEESYNLKLWLEYVLSYPWIMCGKVDRHMTLSELQVEMQQIKLRLNSSIYGMDKCKDVILRYILDFKLGNNPSYTIALCGPPGVGKTCLLQEVARAMQVPFKLIQCGCITDVSYIQGNMKVYVGSAAGCITNAIYESHRNDIIITFDEIEKIYNNINSDALMNQLNHIIDPSSNHSVIDNYIGSIIPVNYSNIMYFATMNDKTKLTNITHNRLKYY